MENNNLERLEKLGFEFLGVLDNEDTVIMEKYKDEELIKESKRRWIDENRIIYRYISTSN